MTAPHRFSSTVERSGRLHYAVVPADDAISLGIPGHAPVVGTANGKGVHCVVTVDQAGVFRILLNDEARQLVGVEAGDEVEFILTRDPNPTIPPVPDDLADALEAIDGSRARWEALSAGHRRELLTWIAEAKSPANRSRRLARTVAKVWE